jgi:hypothetical protein
LRRAPLRRAPLRLLAIVLAMTRRCALPDAKICWRIEQVICGARHCQGLVTKVQPEEPVAKVQSQEPVAEVQSQEPVAEVQMGIQVVKN